MSVINDLQGLFKATVESGRAKIETASTREEMLVNSLSFSLSLHLIYKKMSPFQAELEGAPWNLVIQGETHWKESVPLLTKLINKTLRLTLM